MSDVMEPFVYKLGVEVPHDVIFVVVHHSVKILPDRVFHGRRQLKDVTLPEGLEEIGAHAFYECASLEHINYPSTLIKIGDGAFAGCHSLKEVTLPEGLEQIGECSFHRCVSLGRINCPSSLIKVGNYAFTSCNLECINCPSTLIKIGYGAFINCTSLTKVTLAGGVATIERDTFSDCPSLEGITIPPKAFVIEVEVDSDGDSDDDYDSDSEGDGHVFTCELVLTDNGTIPLIDAKQVIISPEHLNYISSPHLLEIENAITTIMNDQGHTREENIEQVLALIRSRGLFEVSTILELALWKINMVKIDDSTPGTRAECRVTCGSDDIIPGVMSYL